MAYRRISKTWKSTEREVARLFGGQRTPLSGSNSQHKTTADVIKVPRWLYVEVKRRADYNKFWFKIFQTVHDGYVLWAEVAPFTLYFFRIDVFMTQHGKRLRPEFKINLSEHAKIIKFYMGVWKRARAENRDVVICVFRIHRHEGLYAVCDEHSARRLELWVRTKGKPYLKNLKRTGQVIPPWRKKKFPVPELKFV